MKTTPTLIPYPSAEPIARPTAQHAMVTKMLLALLVCQTWAMACRGNDPLKGRALLPWSGWVEDAALQRGYIRPGDFAQFGCPPGWLAVEETAAALRGRAVSTTYVGPDVPQYQGTITCVAQKEFALPPTSAGQRPGPEPVRRPLAPVWVSTETDGITVGFRREVPASAAVYIGRDTPCGPRVIGVRLGDLLKWMVDPSWGPKREFLGMVSAGCPERNGP
jgi:hypothetical protein